LSVTAFIAIVSKAHAHILRLSRARLHDLVVSDWAARAVLRYWRLQYRLRQSLSVATVISPRHGTVLLGHGVVLALGFVLVASALATPTAVPASARESSSQLLWNASLTAANAANVHEVYKADSLELAPTPVSTPAPPPPAPVAPAKPAVVGTFTPPPGSGGSGLAAIQAVFANSPGLSWALRVANCESHYNPLAVNRYSGASGLFQFMPSTWNANFPGQNIWDPYAQARAALVFYNAGRQSAWTCK
jgi:hypothetical protein